MVYIGKVDRVLTAIISYPEGVIGTVIEGLRPAAVYAWERILLNNLK